MLLLWSSVGSISMVSTRPVQVWDSSTREWTITAWPWYRLPRFSSLMVPLTRYSPEDKMLMKGRGCPVMSVPPFTFTSFTTPSTSE